MHEETILVLEICASLQEFEQVLPLPCVSLIKENGREPTQSQLNLLLNRTGRLRGRFRRGRFERGWRIDSVGQVCEGQVLRGGAKETQHWVSAVRKKFLQDEKDCSFALSIFTARWSRNLENCLSGTSTARGRRPRRRDVAASARGATARTAASARPARTSPSSAARAPRSRQGFRIRKSRILEFTVQSYPI